MGGYDGDIMGFIPLLWENGGLMGFYGLLYPLVMWMYLLAMTNIANWKNNAALKT